MRIREIAQSRVRYGYRKIRVLLNREGWNVGKYLVYRFIRFSVRTTSSPFRLCPTSIATASRVKRRASSTPGSAFHPEADRQ